MKIENDYQGGKDITLEKGGERVTVKVGNTVIDIMHGYPANKDNLACPIIELYKYSSDKDCRILIFDSITERPKAKKILFGL